MTLDRNAVRTVLETIRDKRIAVIGDFMLDRYLWGSVTRISPEAPVPVVEVTDDAERPGGAGNVVLNLASLGISSSAVGVVGNDRYGEVLVQLLKEKGADTSGLHVDITRPTTAKTRVIAEDQQVVRVDRENTQELNAEAEEALKHHIDRILQEVDAVILQDYNKGVLTSGLIEHILDRARELDRIVTVDPKREHFFDYYGATLVKPNLREAEGALNRPLRSEASVTRAGEELLVRLQSRMVLITRGSEGMSLFAENQAPCHIPTRARTISDVSGAGDTVISTLTAGLVAGLDGCRAAQLATLAAGYVVGQVGVVPITPEALLAESGD